MPFAPFASGTAKRSALFSAAAVAAALAFTPAHADGDAETGKKVFKKCAACHAVGKKAKNKVGPVLNGVVGRQAATYEGYKYGKSLVAAGEAGLVWTEDELDDYLQDPRAFLREKLDDPKARSKMAYKLKKEDDRENVIAYLKTLSGE